MRPDDWIRIARDIEANYRHYNGFVILHGTDTMSYTASVLSFMLENLRKPVVLTGSQVPLTLPQNDGASNLLGALTVASHCAEITEVCLYFDFCLFRGNRTLKTDCNSFQAFESPNMRPLARIGTSLTVNWGDVLAPAPNAEFRVHCKLGALFVLGVQCVTFGTI